MSTGIQPACFILAGERLSADGKPLFDRAALPWVDKRTMLETLQERFAPLKPRVVREDLIRGLGPMGGVYTALKSEASDWNVVISSDMPFLSAGTVARMIDSLAGAGSAKAAFMQAKVIHPFPCILHRDMIEPVRNLLRSGKPDLMGLVEKYTDQIILLPPTAATGEYEFFEVNTPADYARAKVWAGI